MEKYETSQILEALTNLGNQIGQATGSLYQELHSSLSQAHDTAKGITKQLSLLEKII